MSTNNIDDNKPSIPVYLSRRTLELIRKVADKDELIDYTIRKLVLFYIEYSRSSSSKCLS